MNLKMKEQTSGPIKTKTVKSYDIVVVGASLGGVLAAYSAAKQGYNVLLTEESIWIGGQLTSQGVPLDEHRWIETQGATKSYMDYRSKVRDYYRNHPQIIEELKTKDYFCPGGSTVSRLSHPPKLALKFLNELLEPFIEKGLLTIKLQTKLIDCKVKDDQIESVLLQTTEGFIEVSAPYFLDGTDHGDLIYQSKTEYKIGAESKEETNEPHAKDVADRYDLQPVTWVLAASYDPEEKEDYTIEKPAMYDYFKSLKMPYDDYPILSMFGPDSSTGKAKEFGFFENEYGKNGNKLFGLWNYRRVINKAHFKDGYYPYDVTLINWPQNDYYLNNLLETDDDAHHHYMAKQLTLSFFYYLQNEVVRNDGKIGYKGLILRKDILGSDDGLALMPYVREGRRIESEFTITEQMISKELNEKPLSFFDSVGVGSYSIDLHITTKSHDFYYIDTHPYELPLGALIPKRMKNLIPACKNIGTTHLTNGCYRVHPMEWNIGEVAGLFASYALKHNLDLKTIRNTPKYLKDFQDHLVEEGIQLKWDFSQMDGY